VYDGVLACAEAHEAFKAIVHAPREAIPLVHIAIDASRAWVAKLAARGTQMRSGQAPPPAAPASSAQWLK